MKRSWLLGVSLSSVLWLGAVSSSGCGRMQFDEEGEGSAAPLWPLELSYPGAGTYHALLNETELVIAPASKGVRTFKVSPALPPGLSLNELTGKIHGIPTEAKDRTRYVVTGTGPGLTGAEEEIRAEIYLTVLPGWKISVTSDWGDDNDGAGTCFATMAGGCTLRAAIQTANQAGGKRMILLEEKTYSVAREINGVSVDLVIAGAGIGKTIVKPDTLHPGYRMMFFTNEHSVRLENASFQQFGPVDGGVLQVNNARIEMFQVELSKNASNSTGGVMCVDNGGQAYLENVTFLDNEALLTEARGGVLNASNPGTKITVVRSTAMGNQAKLGSFVWADTGATVEIINSTITGNVAHEGGALATMGATIQVRSSTVAANTTTSNVSAGLWMDATAGSTISLANTIVAGNLTMDRTQANCATDGGASSLLSLGGNLFSNNGDGCKTLLESEPAQLNAELRLDDGAKNNGGHTMTIAIRAGSAAIDRGVSADCPEEDQRGVKRQKSQGSPCDVGAYELVE